MENYSNIQRVIGYDQDYPGSYAWPIYEILCPICQLWSKKYGDVDKLIGDKWYYLCIQCGEEEIKKEELGDY